MKLSIFTTITDPDRRGDNWRDSLNCYNSLADEVVVVNGGHRFSLPHEPKVINYEWPQEFDWPLIGQQFQRGYEATTGDWSIHCDLDYIFHENNFSKIRQSLESFSDSPAVSFYKWQFVQPDRYNLKSRLLIAVNNKFRDRIRFDSGGDLCQPSFNSEQLIIDDMPQAEVPFYNYEKLTKRVDQVADDVGRMDRAYSRHFGKYLYGTGDDQSALDGWMYMMKGRYNKPQRQIILEDHPKFIQKTIKNLEPDQFGFSGFGEFEEHYV